jgi:hypothetical protein
MLTPRILFALPTTDTTYQAFAVIVCLFPLLLLALGAAGLTGFVAQTRYISIAAAALSKITGTFNRAAVAANSLTQAPAGAGRDGAGRMALAVLAARRLGGLWASIERRAAVLALARAQAAWFLVLGLVGLLAGIFWIATVAEVLMVTSPLSVTAEIRSMDAFNSAIQVQYCKAGSGVTPNCSVHSSCRALARCHQMHPWDPIPLQMTAS